MHGLLLRGPATRLIAHAKLAARNRYHALHDRPENFRNILFQLRIDPQGFLVSGILPIRHAEVIVERSSCPDDIAIGTGSLGFRKEQAGRYRYAFLFERTVFVHCEIQVRELTRLER